MTEAAQPKARLPRTVVALGLVSLFTDIGSEIVHSLLPLLLAGPLGASVLVIGLIEGVAEALVLLTKVFSGYLSDVFGRRKPLVLLGYGLAAATKPLFPLAASVGVVIGARWLDRIGKGIRGAPRDALIADVTPPGLRGAAFGLRQSMDTFGAVVGPLLAVGLLSLWGGAITPVLWIAVIPGLIAVALIIGAVHEPAAGTRAPRAPIRRADLAALGRPYWNLVVLGGLLSLARCSEAFLILRSADVGLSIAQTPLALVVMSLVFTASAWPAGWLSDRWSRSGLLALGMAMLVAADLCLAMADGAVLLFAGCGLWGLHLGLSQGLLAAMIADATPAEWRGSAFGMFGLVGGLGLLLASALAGALWQAFGPGATFGCAAVLAGLVLVLLPWLAPRGESFPAR